MKTIYLRRLAAWLLLSIGQVGGAVGGEEQFYTLVNVTPYPLFVTPCRVSGKNLYFPEDSAEKKELREAQYPTTPADLPVVKVAPGDHVQFRSYPRKWSKLMTVGRVVYVTYDPEALLHSLKDTKAERDPHVIAHKVGEGREVILYCGVDEHHREIPYVYVSEAKALKALAKIFPDGQAPRTRHELRHVAQGGTEEYTLSGTREHVREWVRGSALRDGRLLPVRPVVAGSLTIEKRASFLEEVQQEQATFIEKVTGDIHELQGAIDRRLAEGSMTHENMRQLLDTLQAYRRVLAKQQSEWHMVQADSESLERELQAHSHKVASVQERLMVKVAELKVKQAQLKEHIDELKEQERFLREAIMLEQAQKEKARVKRDHFKHELTREAEDIVHQQERTAHVVQQVQQLNVSLRKSEERIHHSRREVQELPVRRAYPSLEKLRRITQSVEQFKKFGLELKEQLKGSRAQLQKAKEERELLSSALRQLEVDLQKKGRVVEKHTAVAREKGHLAQVMEQMREAGERHSELELLIDQVELLLVRVIEQLNGYLQFIERVDEQVKKVLSRATQWQEEIARKGAKVAELEERVGATIHQLQSLEQQLQKVAEQRRPWEEKGAALEKRIVQATPHQLAKLIGSVQLLQEELVQRQREHAHYKVLYDQEKAEKTRNQAMLEAVSADLERERQQIRKLDEGADMSRLQKLDGWLRSLKEQQRHCAQLLERADSLLHLRQRALDAGQLFIQRLKERHAQAHAQAMERLKETSKGEQELLRAMQGIEEEATSAARRVQQQVAESQREVKRLGKDLSYWHKKGSPGHDASSYQRVQEELARTEETLRKAKQLGLEMVKKIEEHSRMLDELKKEATL